MVRSVQFNPTGSSITDASLEVNTQKNWVEGIWDNDKIVNPGYNAFKDVLNSVEAGKAFSHVTNQSGKDAVTAPDPVNTKPSKQASPVILRVVNTPEPAGITAPVNEKPRTVFPPD